MLELPDRPSLESHPDNIAAALDCLSPERRQTVERQLGVDALQLHERVLQQATVSETEIPPALVRPDIVGTATIYLLTQSRLAAKRRVASKGSKHFIVPLKPDILFAS